MNKDEICKRIAAVCNSLNDLTVTGIKNAANLSGAHSVLQETLTALLSCQIIPPSEQARSTAESSESAGGD